MERGYDDLRRLIYRAGFEILESQLLQFARPSVRVHTTRIADEGDISIGASKIGGHPDLPKEMEWPRFSAGGMQKAFHFVAQFRLEDVKPFDVEDLLPEAGWLVFFADPHGEAQYGRDGHVLYLAPSSDLERNPFPDDIPESSPEQGGDHYYPCSVRFVSEINLSESAYDFADNLDIYPAGKTPSDLYKLIHESAYP